MGELSFTAIHTESLNVDTYGDTSWKATREATTTGDGPTVERRISSQGFIDGNGKHGFRINRLGIKFPAVAGVPNGASIVAARLVVVPVAPTFNPTDSAFLGMKIHAVSFSPTNPTDSTKWIGNDFALSHWGSKSLGARVFPDFKVGSPTSIELNVDGIAALSTSQPNFFGLRTSYDVDDVVPPDEPGSFKGMMLEISPYPQANPEDAKLVVTWSTAPKPNPPCWKPISKTNAPSARIAGYPTTCVWTGTRVAIWGGNTTGTSLADGALYDPVADKWTPMATLNAPSARNDHAMAWSGSHLLVWGGAKYPGYTVQQSGGRYDPVLDQWTVMDGSGPGTWIAHAVWTGSQLLYWGGSVDSSQTNVTNQGAIYTPATNKWSPMTTAGAPSKRGEAAAVWADNVNRMLVWGGYPNTLGDGGAYDPVGDGWKELSKNNAPEGRQPAGAVWTGSKMIVWGGAAASSFPKVGGLYEPVSDSWIPTTASGAPTGRYAHAFAWTGTRMLIWGGFSDPNDLDDGAEYDPLSNTWAPIVNQPGKTPSKRHYVASAWTGKGMFVWGGSSGATFYDDGAMYYPVCPN
jgi:hypothetical protein